MYPVKGVYRRLVLTALATAITGWLRSGNELAEIDQIIGWVSPRLGIPFELSDDELQIYRPDGRRFLTDSELAQEQEQEQAEAKAQQAEAELQALRALLQEQGINQY